MTPLTNDQLEHVINMFAGTMNAMRLNTRESRALARLGLKRIVEDSQRHKNITPLESHKLKTRIDANFPIK